MMVLLLSLAAATALSVSAVLSKRLTLAMPARQLVGPLLLLNALIVLPGVLLAPVVVTPSILAIHLLEAGLLAAGSLAVWDLFDHGSPSAVVTAQSLSPIPATIAALVLLPEVTGPLVAAGAGLVVLGILAALRTGFPALGAVRRWATVGVAAVTAGLMAVTSRVLADLGAGVAQTYAVRALVAGVAVAAIVPPRDVPLAAVPRLLLRALSVTAYFLLVLVAVRVGSPAIVQSIVATAPLLNLGYEAVRTRERPVPRVALGTLAVVIGVAAMAVGGP